MDASPDEYEEINDEILDKYDWCYVYLYRANSEMLSHLLVTNIKFNYQPEHSS